MIGKTVELPFGFGQWLNWCHAWGKTLCQVDGYVITADAVMVRVVYRRMDISPEVVQIYVSPRDLEAAKEPTTEVVP